MIDEHCMTLLTDYAGQDISGWYVSEKYDGCRAYWDGNDFWTRNGNVIKAPSWFKEGLPDQHLDGEIFSGYGKFQEARIAAQYGRFTLDIRFVVFDAPEIAGNWETRIEAARTLVSRAPHAESINYSRRTDIAAAFHEVKSRGGEGLVVRNPMTGQYERGRSSNVVRIKKIEDIQDEFWVEWRMRRQADVERRLENERRWEHRKRELDRSLRDHGLKEEWDRLVRKYVMDLKISVNLH